MKSTGKGQFGETVKLFRLMGKNVFVLADLDSLADDNQLVSVFHDGAQVAANQAGGASVGQQRVVADGMLHGAAV